MNSVLKAIIMFFIIIFGSIFITNILYNAYSTINKNEYKDFTYVDENDNLVSGKFTLEIPECRSLYEQGILSEPFIPFKFIRKCLLKLPE